MYINFRLIEKLRISKGVQKEKMASDTGLSLGTIWKMENKPDENPRLTTISPIAKYLGVKIDDIVVEKMIT